MGGLWGGGRRVWWEGGQHVVVVGWGSCVGKVGAGAVFKDCLVVGRCEE